MRDGYFRTGDVGVFDQRGFLSIVGRKKDMVIVSGFNVYPTEVESVASLFPGVMECACVGAPDDKTGEALVLHVVKKLHSELTAEQLIAHCRAALAGYKVPKIVCFEDALPKSTVGKILHRALCQSAERGAFPRFVLLLTQELSMTSDPAQVRLSQGLTRRHVLVFSVGAACLGGSGAFA